MKTELNIMKSSWGIIIQIDAEFISPNELDSKKLLSDDNAKCLIDFDHPKLNQLEKCYILKGISYSLENLNVSMSGILSIHSIELVLTDYQELGLFVAIVKWFKERFNGDLTVPEIVFDKVNGKYEITNTDVNLFLADCTNR